jgi:YesN/AraC family two-component response regulator
MSNKDKILSIREIMKTFDLSTIAGLNGAIRAAKAAKLGNKVIDALTSQRDMLLETQAPTRARKIETIKDFEESVIAATKATSSWRSGAGSRFISQVYDTWKRENNSSMSLEDFKKNLTKTDIELTRADLVEAMPHDIVMRSEITHPTGARWHFINLNDYSY